MSKRLLFVCVENANRSQMAAGFARQFGGEAVEVISAGSRPAEQINPKAIAAMAEIGIDLRAQQPTRLDAVTGPFDAVITMGCGDQCPWLPARLREDWALADPKHLDPDAYRGVRDDIGQRVRDLLARL